MIRKILHLDLDAFFCSVEEIMNPSLKGLPFATGGSPEGRGVITSCSYAARKKGIHSAMPSRIALKIYPQLILVQSHYEEYKKASIEIMKILHEFTPLIEQISIDEAFLDVSDLPDAGKDIAERIQKKIYMEMCLPCSIGIATNKLVAKIATNIAKSNNKSLYAPMAILEIPPGEEEKFLSKLPIRELWGIGEKTAAQFESIGCFLIGDIAEIPISLLEKQFGQYAHVWKKRATGIDDRQVGEVIKIKSISNEITFSKDVKKFQSLKKVIRELSKKMVWRLRKKGLGGTTIRIKIRWSNFETHTKQITLSQPTNQFSLINQFANDLLKQIWKKEKAVRLLGVAVTNLSEMYQQLNFLERDFLKEEKLENAIELIRKKFGEQMINRGNSDWIQHFWKE